MERELPVEAETECSKCNQPSGHYKLCFHLDSAVESLDRFRRAVLRKTSKHICGL